MALPASGLITMQQIATEFGGSAPHSLSEYYGKAAGIPTSGAIAMNQFHGKSAINTYRYWRIFMANNNGGGSFITLHDVELRSSIGGSDLTNASTPVVASTTLTTQAGFTADKIVDGSTATNWASENTMVTNQWVYFDLYAPTLVQEIAIYGNPDFMNRNPKDITIQGANDAISWETVKSFPGTNTWQLGVYKYFVL